MILNEFSKNELNFLDVTKHHHNSTPAKCNYTTSPNIRATFRAIYETHLPGLVEKLKFRLPTFSHRTFSFSLKAHFPIDSIFE